MTMLRRCIIAGASMLAVLEFAGSRKRRFHLRNSVVLITGGGRGLGLEPARQAAGRSATPLTEPPLTALSRNATQTENEMVDPSERDISGRIGP